jgi:hypothetical protein
VGFEFDLCCLLDEVVRLLVFNFSPLVTHAMLLFFSIGILLLSLSICVACSFISGLVTSFLSCSHLVTVTLYST